jgi:hypothetical protein
MTVQCHVRMSVTLYAGHEYIFITLLDSVEQTAGIYNHIGKFINHDNMQTFLKMSFFLFLRNVLRNGISVQHTGNGSR